MKPIDVIYNDEVFCQVHPYVFGKKPSLPQGCSSIEEFAAQFALLEIKQAKAYAIRRLSKQAMLSTALAKALRQYCVSQHTIDLLIEEFLRLGYLNDEEWTNSYVKGQVSRKRGPRDIAQRLSHKGLPREQVAEVIETLSDEQQRHAIGELLASKYRNRDLSDYKEKQKVIAALMRRGFDFDQILQRLAAGIEQQG